MDVVGVVADVKQFGLDAAPTADLYVPLPQMPASQAPLLAARTYWMVRSGDDSRALVNAQIAMRIRCCLIFAIFLSLYPRGETAYWRLNAVLNDACDS